MDFIRKSKKHNPFVLDKSLWSHAIGGDSMYSDLLNVKQLYTQTWRHPMDDDNQHLRRRDFPTREHFIRAGIDDGMFPDRATAIHTWNGYWAGHSDPPRHFPLFTENHWDTGANAAGLPNPDVSGYGYEWINPANPGLGHRRTNNVIHPDYYRQRWLNRHPNYRKVGWTGMPGNWVVRRQFAPLPRPPAPPALGG